MNTILEQINFARARADEMLRINTKQAKAFELLSGEQFTLSKLDAVILAGPDLNSRMREVLQEIDVHTQDHDRLVSALLVYMGGDTSQNSMPAEYEDAPPADPLGDEPVMRLPKLRPLQTGNTTPEEPLTEVDEDFDRLVQEGIEADKPKD